MRFNLHIFYLIGCTFALLIRATRRMTHKTLRVLAAFSAERLLALAITVATAGQSTFTHAAPDSLTLPTSPNAPIVALNAQSATVELWPSATFLHDPEGKLSTAEVIASPEKFTALKSAYATLGLRQKVM